MTARASAAGPGILCAAGLAVGLGFAASRFGVLMAAAAVLVLSAGFWLLEPARRALRDAGAMPGAAGRVELLAVAVGVLLVTFNGIRPAESLNLGDPFFLVAGGLAVASILAGRQARVYLPPWLLASALLIAITGAMTALMVENQLNELSYVLRFVGTLVLLPVILCRSARTDTGRDLLIRCWMWSVIINGGVGLMDLLLHTGIGSSITGIEYAQNRQAGLTLQPNHLAVIGVMALPVALQRLASARNPSELCFGLLATIASAGGVLASGSRGGIAVALVVGPLLFALQRLQRARLIAVAGILVGMVALAPLAGLGGSSDLLNGLNRLKQTTKTSDDVSVTFSDQQRREQLDKALEAVQTRPLTGVGFTTVRLAHNTYVQVLAGGGVLALLGFLWFIAGGLREGVRLARSRELAPDAASLSAALTVALAAWFIGGLVQPPLFERYLYLPLGILLAMTAAWYPAVAGAGRTRQPWSRSPAIARVDPVG